MQSLITLTQFRFLSLIIYEVCISIFLNLSIQPDCWSRHDVTHVTWEVSISISPPLPKFVYTSRLMRLIWCYLCHLRGLYQYPCSAVELHQGGDATNDVLLFPPTMKLFACCSCSFLGACNPAPRERGAGHPVVFARHGATRPHFYEPLFWGGRRHGGSPGHWEGPSQPGRLWQVRIYCRLHHALWQRNLNYLLVFALWRSIKTIGANMVIMWAVPLRHTI